MIKKKELKIPLSSEFKEGLWEAFYEYLIIIVPIGIYVFFEAHHRGELYYFYKSPEWDIATIFLAFIGINKYSSEIIPIRKKFSKPIFGIFQITVLLIIISAIYNTKISIEAETSAAIFFRITLFSITSIIFFIFIIGKNLLKKEKNV